MNLTLSCMFAVSRSRVLFLLISENDRLSWLADSVLNLLNFLVDLPSYISVISFTTMYLLPLVLVAPGSFQHILFPLSWRKTCLYLGGPIAPYLRNVVPNVRAFIALAYS